MSLQAERSFPGPEVFHYEICQNLPIVDGVWVVSSLGLLQIVSLRTDVSFRGPHAHFCGGYVARGRIALPRNVHIINFNTASRSPKCVFRLNFNRVLPYEKC